MKIAIALSAESMESPVDAHFGRCPFYLLFDLENNKAQIIENKSGKALRGAGVSAAQMIVDKGVKAVIAGNFGPNAFNVLKAAGVRLFKAASGQTAKQALENYQRQELEELNRAFSSGITGGFGWGRQQKGGRIND